MALVDDDEVEEVRRILAEIGAGVAILGRPAHEGLEDGKEDAAVRGHSAPACRMESGINADQGIFGEGGKGVVSLVGEDVAVGQEQDTRATGWFAAQVPAAMEQFPGDLKRDERLARAGSQRQQDALPVRPRWPPSPVQRRCPGSSGSDASRPCPQTVRQRSGHARCSAWQRSGSRAHRGVGYFGSSPSLPVSMSMP